MPGDEKMDDVVRGFLPIDVGQILIDEACQALGVRLGKREGADNAARTPIEFLIRDVRDQLFEQGEERLG